MPLDRIHAQRINLNENTKVLVDDSSRSRFKRSEATPVDLPKEKKAISKQACRGTRELKRQLLTTFKGEK